VNDRLQIKFVDRPVAGPITETRRALLETLTNGRAVVVPLHGRSVNNVQSPLRVWLKKQGYRFHYRRAEDGATIVAWAEPARKESKERKYRRRPQTNP
jgi:hypothetical protein